MDTKNVIAISGVVIGFIAIFAGYIMNIVAIAGTYDLPLNGLFLLRVIGIFVPPIGVIMGWFF